MRATWLAWAIGGLLATALAGTSVRAQEATGFELMFDVAFGGTVTTDYMSRGTTQTDGGPAIQGYVEADLNNFYVGLFAANVNYGFDDTEIDLSAGWRPEWNDVTFDFGYIHYFYVTDSGSAYGEFYAQADWATNDWLTVGGNSTTRPTTCNRTRRRSMAKPIRRSRSRGTGASPARSATRSSTKPTARAIGRGTSASPGSGRTRCPSTSATGTRT